jgi:uncharacterized protein
MNLKLITRKGQSMSKTMKAALSLLVAAIVTSLSIAGYLAAQTKGYVETEWKDLMPEKWQKEMWSSISSPGKSGGMHDGSLEATAEMDKQRKRYDNAPIEPSIIGKKIRIAGYIVPLDVARDKQREFLLVPYFGACIHVPPPPANQLILVRSTAATKMKQVPETMSIVWIEGTLKEARVSTEAGVSGYLMEPVSVYPWQQTK